MSSSSTSSSSRSRFGRGASRPWAGRVVPWAGLLAVLLGVGLESIVYQQRALWAWLAERDSFGVASAHLALMDVAAAPPLRPRVLVVGPSRVQSGFSLADARRDQPELSWAKVTHPRFDAFAIRSMVDDLLAVEPAAVVFLWSELDTNRPLRLEPIPGSTAVSLSALWELLQWAGPGFAVEHRTSIYRLVAERFERTYRYRPAFEGAGLDSLARFSLNERLQPETAIRPRLGPVAVWDAEANSVSETWRARMIERFPKRTQGYFAASVDRVAEVTPGSHAGLMRKLMQRTVEILDESGVEVVIIEAPLHPAAGQIYDAVLRASFLEFAGALERSDGVHFVPLEAMSRFGARDFADMIHVYERGTEKLTRAIERAVVAVLEEPPSPR